MSNPDSNKASSEETQGTGSPSANSDAQGVENGSSSPGDKTEKTAAGGMAQDPRFSRLMKMQSSFVTEESLRSTEERSKPAKIESDEELLDDELDDESDLVEDDNEDENDPEEIGDASNSYHPPSHAPSEPDAEEETDHGNEPDQSSDHRIARLRKLRHSMIRDNDMQVKSDVETDGSDDVLRNASQAIVLCPNCQAEEPRGNKICDQCGARLPNLTSMQEQRYNPGTYNKAVQKYVKAVESVNNGNISVAEFVEFLEERQETSKVLLDELFDSIEEAEAEDWLPEATSLIEEASNMLEESIDVMLFKVQSAAYEYLEEYEHIKNTEDYEPPETEEEAEAEQAEIEASIEEKVRIIDFSDQIATIKVSSDQMHAVLRLLDEYMRRIREDFEVSI